MQLARTKEIVTVLGFQPTISLLGLLRAKRLSNVVWLLVFATAGCGSAGAPSGPSPVSPSPGPAPVPIVTITGSGVNPTELATTLGSRVTFINRDAIPHDIAGGSDPSHPDCREIDAVGFLAPGQSRETAPFELARTCEYHDHAHSPYVFGRILIR